MPNIRGKSKIPTQSKKQKVTWTSSSSSPTATTRHIYLTFDHPPHEERYQHLKDRSLGLGRCINWEALEKVGLSAWLHTLLDATSWEQFFVIVKPTDLISSWGCHLVFEYCGIWSRSRIYYDDFLATLEFSILSRHVHRLNPLCWSDISKSMSVVGNLDAYFLWSMYEQYLIDLAHFVADPPANHFTTTPAHTVTLKDISRLQEQQSERIDRIKAYLNGGMIQVSMSNFRPMDVMGLHYLKAQQQGQRADKSNQDLTKA
ncbi:hypothetical protein Gogos_021722, partial [Gossypium gossypioides]|nr:hypothetical protein [Gossypium gossypioides]